MSIRKTAKGRASRVKGQQRTAETRRVNITLPADWHAAFKRAAKARGESVSQLLRDAARQTLPQRVAAGLSTPIPAGRAGQRPYRNRPA